MRAVIVLLSLVALAACNEQSSPQATTAPASVVAASLPATATLPTATPPIAALPPVTESPAATSSTTATSSPTPPSAPTASRASSGPASVSNIELLGGYRLDVAFASEGLGLVRDSDGFVTEMVAGAHAHSYSVHLYDLRAPRGAGADAASYPLVSPLRTWSTTELFPRWIDRQNLRDVTVVNTATGYLLAGIGRVYYNTNPRPITQINVREIIGSGATATLGAAYEIPVNLPKQEFSGFIKHDDARRDLTAIGAGAYDSGQGSVGGLSYAVKQTNGTWMRLLTPPGFGDTTSPRLPRDADYSCPDGLTWVCISPANGRGTWSTERIGGGGVRYGDNILFIPMLGYGPRTYGHQTYTFGDASLNRAHAYFFRQNSVTGAVSFQSQARWPHAAVGEHVIGVAIGRVRGVNEPVLFVVKGDGWQNGRWMVGSVVQLFRVVSN